MGKKFIAAMLLAGLIVISFSALPGRTNAAVDSRASVRQCNFLGGTSPTEAVSYAALGSWTKVAEVNNINPTTGQPVDFATASNPDITYFISSPIDISGGEVFATHGITTGTSLPTRQSDTIAGLASAPWFSPSSAGTHASKRYIQFKKGLVNDCVELYFSNILVTGSVKSSGGAVLTGFTICEGTYCSQEPNTPGEASAGVYIFSKNFDAGNSRTAITLTASRSGYKSQSVTVGLVPRTDPNNVIVGGYIGQYNFVLQPESTATTTTASPRSSTNPTAQTTALAVQTPPAVPVLESLMVGNTQFAANKILENKFKQNEKKTFSGKTIPNGVVHLYFHSEPFEATTTADATGTWSYVLSRDLGAGDHILQIAVTDPTTNLTSEKSAETKFILVAGVNNIQDTTTALVKSNYAMYYIGAGAILAVVLGILGYLYFAKKLFFAKLTKTRE